MATATRAAEELDREVLDLVAGLVAELGGPVSRSPTLDDSLDRDLGISSLERVELLLRIERAFGVRLPDSVMAEAATPRELVSAIGRAGHTPLPSRPPSISTAIASAATFDARQARTLVDVLRGHAEHSPDRVHLYLRNDDGSESAVSYGELLTGASAVAAGLGALGIGDGDRVALMLRTERAFFDIFFGALLAGAVPVPLYPPIRAEDLLMYARRQQAILRNAGASALVTFDEAARVAAHLKGQTPSIAVVTTAAELSSAAADVRIRRPAAESAALIQYTSGSTGDPKGVLLSHANLLANIRAIGEAIDVRPDDATVSWLPLYHDMGLIGAWLGSLYFGVPVALMSPFAFLSRPSRWLWTIASHRATVSPSPNFGFDLCVRKIDDDEIRGLDLSSWRLAFNGSEAVGADTIERFTRRFAPYGFRPSAMCPVYGLAEASVGLTVSRLGRAPRVDTVVRGDFERGGHARPAASDAAHPLSFVSCGRPLPRHEVRVVDAADHVVGDRIEGHIQFRGPSVTRGYFDNDVATRAAMHDGWMDSGDLGYSADGELFVTGREKDLIIQAGRNICAQEVDAIVGDIEGIRKGCVATFGVRDPSTGTERLVVVAESREQEGARREGLRRAVRDRLVERIGTPADVVVIAAPHTVLKTPSGKIRRSAMRDAYAKGTLGRSRSTVRQRAQLAVDALNARTAVFAELVGRVAFTGWIAIVLVASLPLLWIYLAVCSPGRHANRATQWWSRIVLGLCGLRPAVAGLEKIGAAPSGGILVSNHSSYIDSIVLMAAIPVDFHFVAKRRLSGYPLIGTVIRKARHVTIEKAGVVERLAGADTVVERLAAGDLLMIFPEGTFQPRPGLLPFRLGAFRAAVEAGRPVLPVAIAGTRRVLPDGTWLLRRAPIVVSVGAPLFPQAEGWAEMVRLRDRAVDEIARGSGEHAAPPAVAS